MKKYKVVTSVSGKNFDKTIGVFKEQVSLRPHFTDSNVHVDSEGKLIVDVNVEGYSEDEVSRFVTEQIWDICSAILKDLNPLDLKVESVEESR